MREPGVEKQPVDTDNPLRRTGAEINREQSPTRAGITFGT